VGPPCEGQHFPGGERCWYLWDSGYRARPTLRAHAIPPAGAVGHDLRDLGGELPPGRAGEGLGEQGTAAAGAVDGGHIASKFPMHRTRHTPSGALHRVVKPITDSALGSVEHLRPASTIAMGGATIATGPAS